MPKTTSKWDTNDFSAQRLYNCQDIWHTWVLRDILSQKLEQAGRMEVYKKIYQPLFEPLLDMSVRGVKVNVELMSKEYEKLGNECTKLLKNIENVVGKPLHTNKGLSVKKLTEYLYNTIGFKQLTESPSDELALKVIRYVYGSKVKHANLCGAGMPTIPISIFNSYKKKFATVDEIERWQQGLPAIDLILEFRKLAQARTFLQPERIDEDGRFRVKYKFTTMFCRLASSKNPFGTGANAQNIPSEAKRIFIPNESDHVFLELDSSQVEWRILCCLTGDPELIKLAKMHPDDFDVHKLNASIIFKIAQDAVDEAKRQTSKRVVHAGDYGEGSERLSSVLIVEDDIFVPPNETQKYIDNYMDRFPAIPKWQKDTAKEVVVKKQLENSWGQVFDFYWDVVLNGPDKHLINRALACRPQSDAGIHLNVQGLVPSWNLIQRKYPTKAQLCMTVHDSLLFSVHKKYAYELACRVRDSMQKEHDFYGTMLSVPAQAKVGPNYKELVKIKDLNDLKGL